MPRRASAGRSLVGVAALGNSMWHTVTWPMTWQRRPSGVGEDRNIDTARTIEGGIGHDLPQEAAGAFAEAILEAGRSELARRKEKEWMRTSPLRGTSGRCSAT